MGYEVVIEEIRRAARSGAEAAATASKAAPHLSAESAAAALPGTISAAALTVLADRWRTRLADWAGDLAHHSANLARAADLYAASDARAAADLHSPAIRSGLRGD